MEKSFAEQCVFPSQSHQVQIFIHDPLSSEVFVSDKGCNLFSLDLRNGAILCGYKGTDLHYL